MPSFAPVASIPIASGPTSIYTPASLTTMGRTAGESLLGVEQPGAWAA